MLLRVQLVVASLQLVEFFVSAAFYDLAASGKALTPGATYKASFGGRELVFKIDPGAQAGRTAVVGRLLRFGASN